MIYQRKKNKFLLVRIQDCIEFRTVVSEVLWFVGNLELNSIFTIFPFLFNNTKICMLKYNK